MIRIELLSEKNFSEHSLDDYSRKHEVKRVWRRVNGEYALVDMPYTEDWDIEKRRQVARDIGSGNYVTYAAFDGEKIVGFIGLLKQLKDGYMILDMMHVSSECRGKGLGRKLFELGKAEAAKSGATALYISACSSEETIAFYKAMGAVLADEPIREIAESEPFDLQMICTIG